MRVKIIICLDDNNGMLFNNRRQSRDRVVIEDVFNTLGDEKLCVNEFSVKLFTEYQEHIKVVDKPCRGEFFFAENVDLNSFKDEISQIIVYKWNRVYPYDFSCNLDFSQFNIVEQIEFQGFSHEKITKIIYNT